MKKRKRIVSALLAAMLCVTGMPVLRQANAAELAGAEDTAGSGGGTENPASDATENLPAEAKETIGDPSDTENLVEKKEIPTDANDIRYNLGDFEYRMTDRANLEQMYEEAEKLAEGGDDSMMVELIHYQAYEEDSNYAIELEQNAFFPYEVQFTENGTVTEAWFMSPEDTVTIGGHVFSVHSQTDGTVLTQMSLNVAGDTVVVYPEKKTFTNDGEGPASAISLLPLKPKYLTVNLSKYSPVELTRVSVDEIFSGEEKFEKASAVIWTYSGDDYTVSKKGDQLDLCYGSDTSTSWTMILGEADQLEKDNIRYYVTVKHVSFSDWLQPTYYFQKQDGTREQGLTGDTHFYTNSSDSRRELYFYTADNTLLGYRYGSNSCDQYISIQENKELYPERQYTLKAFEGVYNPATDGSYGTDITEQLFAADMKAKNAGYQVDWYYPGKIVTIVSYDKENKVTGCLPFYIRIYDGDGRISLDSIRDKDGKAAGYSSTYREAGYTHATVRLYSGYSANSPYTYRLSYSKVDKVDNSVVAAAYVGDYESIEAAKAAKAADVKASLFGDSGYTTDQHTFTIFLGKDGKEKYQYVIKLEEYTNTDNSYLSSNTYISFSGICGSKGEYINSRVCNGDLADSYTVNSYITILTKEANLKNIALKFSEYNNIVLYSEKGTKVESGKTCFDFSNGPVQFTAASEDKSYQRNYWVQVINPNDSIGAQQLYINSLKDHESHTEVKDGVVCSTREVMLNGLYDYQHDILVVNRGKDPLPQLSAELQSDEVELDEYWTLTGNNNLEGFSEDSLLYESNLAKIRIRAKKTAAAGSEIKGTLTIKSGNTKLMELNLTGTVGDPTITTETIPQSVKYVPYGTMIQNNNKYSWNTVSYYKTGGKLPNGVELKRNGELYGVPKEVGEFKFEVRMDNSYGRFASSTKELTLTVVDNTDENVEQATDADYSLSRRIGDIDVSSTGEYLIVSEGAFEEYQDIYLDGEKLVKGTDYTAESGSTRITITAQTLKKNGSLGSHTIGIEFRDTKDEVKKAAQNYKVTQSGSEDIGGNNSNSSSGSSSSNSGGSNGNSSGGSSNSGGNNNTNSGGNNNVTGDIDTDNTEDASNTIVKIITNASRAASVKKPEVTVLQNLFDKRKIEKGAAALLEVIERLLNMNTV